MAVDFPTSPSDGDTVTVGTKTYSYNASKGVWKDIAGDDLTPSTLSQYMQVANTTALTDQYLQVANSSSIGVTSYNDITDLPMSNQTTGKLAFVSGNNRLYIWNGTGWYNIALINTSPSISGASSSYSLNTDGSNTVVTLVASDPEGLPISFTASHTGLGVGANAIATVTQSNNIFTFTPTTNTALAGTFTTTFTASDGVNIAGANSSFTLSFTVNNSKYTTALVTSVGTNGSFNNSFVDSSTNSHTVTKSGNATQTTFSPYRHGGYSTYFDGTGDYLKVASSSTFNLYNTSFTIEGWFYATAPALAEHIFASYIDASNRESLYFSNSTTLNWWVNGSTRISATVEADKWYHVAIVDNGGTTTMYINGASQGTWTSAYTDGNRLVWIGTYNDGASATDSFTGYISDWRVVKGTAVYTSTFTPTTERLTAVTNTSLLTCHLPYIAAGSTNGHSITVNGNTKTEPFAPYDYKTYTSGDHGGSMYFDGSGDYLTIAHDTTLKPGTSGAFSVEFWYYPTATPSGNPAQIAGDLGVTSYPSNVHGFDLIHDTSGNLNVRWGAPSYQDGSSGDGGAITNNALALNQWHHIVLCRDAESTPTMALFRNGNRCWYEAGSQVAIADATASNFYVGYAGNASGTTFTPITGHISDFKFRKGATSFDPTSSTLTVSSTPSSSDTETSLLISGTNAGIIDKSQSAKQLTLTADVQSSNLQTNLNTTSILFDGTSDKIEIPDFQLLRDGRDFTIEFWIYLANTSAERNILETFSFSATSGWTIYHLSGGRLDFYPHHTNLTTLSATTWTHIAIENYGGTIKCFVNGTSTYSATHSNTSTPTAGLRIGTRSGTGNYFIGYMEDIRITDGYARYQGSNFTAPTAPLEA